MKRLSTVLVVLALALGGLTVGSAAAYIQPYTGPGEWFGPGRQANGNYDWCGGHWYGNHFSRTPGYLGLVTFIKPNGGWTYSRQNKDGHLVTYIPAGQERFDKKPMCRNSSSYWYQGGCWGDRRESGPCA